MKRQLFCCLVFIAGLCFFGCNKNGDDLAKTNTPITDAQAIKIKSWLETKKEYSKDKIGFTALVNSLDWSSTDQSSYQGSSTMITIPITQKIAERKYASKFTTDDRTTNYLVITIDNTGEVQQGTIGQTTPSEFGGNLHASKLIGDILSNSCSVFNGTFTMMTLDRNFMYQFTYAEHVRRSESSFLPLRKGDIQKIRTNGVRSLADVRKSLARNSEVRSDDICYDWYWFEFWDDGTVTATYLGTVCEPVPGELPCAEAALGNDGKLGQVRVDCYSYSGYNSGADASGMIIVNVKPTIPGNDSVFAQSSAAVHGSYGLFTSANFQGSWLVKNNAHYTYIHQGGESTIYNAGPTPYIYFSFIGEILYGPNLGTTVSQSRNFTYRQVFH